VEAVPTPEENPLLMAYFLKKGYLNEFRPCNLVAVQFPQKEDDLQVVRKTGGQPGAATTENYTGLPEGQK
jgi:hypothetical protein